MVPFQNMPKIRQQKWYHFKKGLKFLNKNDLPFQKMAKIGQQKRYHLRIFHLAPLNLLKLNPLLTSGMKKRGFKMVPFGHDHFRLSTLYHS